MVIAAAMILLATLYDLYASCAVKAWKAYSARLRTVQPVASPTIQASSRPMWIQTIDVFVFVSPETVTNSRLTFLLPALELIGFRASQGSDVHVHVLTHTGAYQVWRVFEKR